MINHNAVNLVGDILESINDTFEVLEDFAPHDELERIGLTMRLKRMFQTRRMDFVGVALHANEPFSKFMEASAVGGDIPQQAAWLPRPTGQS